MAADITVADITYAHITAVRLRMCCSISMKRAAGTRDSEAAPSEPRKPRQLSPLQRAIGLLSRREHSRRELVRKLDARGVDPLEAEAAVARLAEDGWQDDDRFAESLVRSRAGSGYGPVRIRAELATHGLDEPMVSTALARYEGNWFEHARDLVRRRIGACIDGDLPLQRKAADLLYRRGFTGDQVRAVVRGIDPDE